MVGRFLNLRLAAAGVENLAVSIVPEQGLRLALITMQHVQLLQRRQIVALAHLKLVHCALAVSLSVETAGCLVDLSCRECHHRVLIRRSCRRPHVEGVHLAFVQFLPLRLVARHRSILALLKLLERHLGNERGRSVRPTVRRHSICLLHSLHLLRVVARKIGRATRLRLGPCTLCVVAIFDI